MRGLFTSKTRNFSLQILKQCEFQVY
jgi:hypothetical protein